ncbi:hypothetical protein [Rhizobium leucaenae]|uniref:hypothetical protein n=1 Tax=Rhizobium leucaenae TaxID=29450 RepID=UPI0004915CB8|nr:hypothetical protein [Rhizobium leucaenae]
MKIAGFEFADGARFQSGANTNAKAVGEHLDLLRQKLHGELTPKDVLDDARHDNSPLHSFFEWDDSEAAEQYRLQQARGLIRSVVAIYTQPDKPAIRTKMFVHIPEPGAQHYREASHAMSQTATRKAVLQTAWRELQAWRKRYSDLKEFSDLFQVIDDAAKDIKRAA